MKVWAWSCVKKVGRNTIIEETDFEAADKILYWVEDQRNARVGFLDADDQLLRKRCFEAAMETRTVRSGISDLISIAVELYDYTMAKHPGFHPKKEAKTGSSKKSSKKKTTKGPSKKR